MGWKMWAAAGLVLVALACDGRSDDPLADLAARPPISGPYTEFDIGQPVEVLPGIEMIITDVNWTQSITRSAQNPLFADRSLEALGRRPPTAPVRITTSPRGDHGWFMIVDYTMFNRSKESIDLSSLPDLIYIEDDAGEQSPARHFNRDAPLPIYGGEDTLFDVPILRRLDSGQVGQGLLVFEPRADSDLTLRSESIGITMELPAHLSPEFLRSN